MSKIDSHASPGAEGPGKLEKNADWQQLEKFIEQLHDWSRAPIEPPEFYHRLLDGCVTLLAASGGAVWLSTERGGWQPTCQIEADQLLGDAEVLASHANLLQNVATTTAPLVLQPNSRGTAGEKNPTSLVLALSAVAGSSGTDDDTHAIVELFFQSGSSPAVQLGWQELLITVCQLASEYHVYQQLRKLRGERGFYDQALTLMRRFQRTTDLRQTAFEIANEGRGFAAADRLSVVMRQGQRWQLLAASGADRIESRADATKRLQMLAASTADWGEPLEYADAKPSENAELPPELAELIEKHVDESQARRLVAVPIEFDHGENDQPQRSRVAAVLIAEQFSSEGAALSRERVLELAELCAPALRQARQLDRFPVRNCLRWADHWTQVCEAWGLTKLTLAAAVVLAVLAALVLVPYDFEVEASATIVPLVERDIFATTDGKVAEVRIVHGQQVEANEVLAVLQDPQLSLDVERVQGEIETTRKRLEAIAVARTDRKVREETTNEKLPLSAEAEQLEKRLASLQKQQEILARRREALTLRSPIAGQVLTLDVQNLLLTRPVARGQVLFTVADTTAGWRLAADLPQDRIGHVVAAQHELGQQLPVRFRLAGDTERTFSAHLDSISTTAVLDTTELDQASPAFEVLVAVDENELFVARPGMNAQVRIHCGRRSLGYVWLHDVWDAVYSWWVF